MFLSPLSEGKSTLVPVPLTRFRAPVGRPRNVKINGLAPEVSKADSAAKENGLRYENKVQRFLNECFDARYIPNPRIEFRDDLGPRVCFPDGILLAPDRLVIFEIKIGHMPEAWWQLKRLYEPVLREWRGTPSQVVEVVKSYDPAVPFPVGIELIDNLQEWVKDETKMDSFGVFVWKP